MLRKKYFLFISLSCFLSAAPFYQTITFPKILTITPGSWDNEGTTPIGFFAYFKSIVGCLNFYDQMKERKNYAGTEIILNKGPYLCPQLGPNWWEYYFEPIANAGGNFSRVKESFHEMVAFTFRENFSRKQAYNIIQKYIAIKPYIQQKVDDYMQKNFGDYVIIGVHYRGTDKVLETPRVSYQFVYSSLQKVIATLGTGKYKIFVATDEQKFIDYMRTKFKNVIYTDSARSNDDKPVHYQLAKSYLKPYMLGEEALIDCLLLSKCKILVKTVSSHFGSTAGAFNPYLPIISLGTSSSVMLNENTNYND